MSENEDQLTKIKDSLSELADREDYKLISQSLGKLRALASSSTVKESSARNAVATEVQALLNLLLEMHGLINSKVLEPHDALKKIILASTGSYEVQIAYKVYSFTRAQFLTEAFQEIKQKLDTIPVPVVPLVMTQAEALQLSSKAIFEAFPQADTYFNELSNFQKQLEAEKVTGLLHRYGTTREKWKPFIDREDTIGDLITQALSRVNNFKRPLRPEFVDIMPLTDDATESARRPDLKLLRDEGCLVVMDVISLMHPVIQRAYRRSLIDVYPNVLVIAVAPTQQATKGYPNNEMIAFAEKFSRMEFCMRLKLDSDVNYCDEVFDADYFTRSVQNKAPFMVDGRIQKTDSKNIHNEYKDLNVTA